MTSLLLVMSGGAIGAGGRYAAGIAAGRLLGLGFPWGTLFVNLAGGLAMGLVAGLVARLGGGDGWRLFLAVGVLGGFTTFSAFSLEVVLMLDRGEIAPAATYILASVLGAACLLWAGLQIAKVAA